MRSFALSRGREDDYPGVFQEIRKLVGEENTAKLVSQFGGTKLYIPSRLKSSLPLCILLGEEVAFKLLDEFGGMTVDVPRDAMLKARLEIEQRNKLIVEDCIAGMSESKLAIKYQLTGRTIRKVTKGINKAHLDHLLQIEDRNELICIDYVGGMSVEQLSLKYQTSIAVIYAATKECRTDNRRQKKLERNRQIFADIRGGMSASKASSKYQLHITTIRKIINS